MFVVPTKLAVTDALRKVFDGSYPVEDFRNINVTNDYPYSEQDYPGVWVQFDATQDLQKGGIDHREFIVDDLGITRQVTRWRFGGTFHFTASALSSLERDRLFDEVVRVLAFTSIDETPAGRFKSLIEQNEYIGININYDVLTPSAESNNPGTPWGTDATIYERTLSVVMIGEFVSDIQSNALYKLSRIDVQGFIEGDNDDIADLNAGVPDNNWSPDQWS